MDAAHLNACAPILNVSLRERAIKKIDEISAYLCKHSDTTPGYGLFTGKTGIALFFYYYYRLSGDDRYLDRVESLLNAAIQDINEEPISYFSHCDGISGAAWCIDFLQEEGILGFGSETVFEKGLLDIVQKQAMDYLREGNFDFLHGAIGLLLYLVDRGADVTEGVELLIRSGEEGPDMIKWKSPDHKQKTKNCYNLSLSHGNASILHLLTSVFRQDEDVEIGNKIDKLANFILSCRNLPGLTFSSFPNLIPIPQQPVYEDSRLAWCYGDLGIAYLLYRTGLTIDDGKLQKESLAILENTTRRTSDKETFIADASFCHGTIGIAHVYGKLFRLSGIGRFREAAEFWYDRTLAYGNVINGAAGYETWRVGGAEKLNTLLEGISGIGLSLISAVSDISPDWDKFMILD